MLSKGFLSEVFDFAEEALLEEFCEAVEILELKRGQQIIKLGDIPQHAYFLISGVFRGFYIDEKDMEVTDFFVHRRGSLMVSSYDLTSPASVNITAASKVRCIRVPMKRFQSFLCRYPEVARKYNECLASSLRDYQQIKQAMNKYDCEQRYQWFLESYPGLVEQVWLKDIASFLDMTPVTLSRIRKKCGRGGEYQRRPE